MTAAPSPPRAALRQPTVRVASVLLGLVLTVPVAIGAFLTTIAWFAVSEPPSVWVQGDFFSAADSWGAVAREIAIATGAAVLIAAVGALAVGLMGWGLWLRRPAGRWVAAGLVAFTVLYGASAVAREVWHADEAVLPPPCASFSIARSALAGGGVAARNAIDLETNASKQAMLGIAACDVLDGRDAQAVETSLGRPFSSVPRSGPHRKLLYGRLELWLEDGRVVRSEIDAVGRCACRATVPAWRHR